MNLITLIIISLILSCVTWGLVIFTNKKYNLKIILCVIKFLLDGYITYLCIRYNHPLKVLTGIFSECIWMYLCYFLIVLKNNR